MQSLANAQVGVLFASATHLRTAICAALAHDADALLGRLNLLLCAGQLSATTRSRLAEALQEMAVTPASDARTRKGRVAQAVLMVMMCPEYLVQK
jgi:hypothetical protein